MRNSSIFGGLMAILAIFGPGCKTSETVVENSFDFNVPESKPGTIVDSRLKQLREKVRDYPRRADIHYDMAALQFQQENFRDSADSLREAIYLEPEQPKYHFHLGRVHLYMGEKEEAAAEFQKAVELTPDGRYTGPNFALGYTLSLLRKWEESREQFKICIRVDPADPMPYYFLGAIADLHKDRDNAVHYLREYIERGGRQFYVNAKDILKLHGVVVEDPVAKAAVKESKLLPVGQGAAK